MIIKAGTYRFKDTITAIGNDSGYGNVITDFYLPDKGYECTEIRVFYDSTVQYVEDGGQIRTPYDSANGGWVYGDTWKTIVIYDDTEVDEASYTWFTSNTTMLIKTGTYRWNDVPTLPTTELIQDNFNFIVPPHTFTITQEMADSFNNIIGSIPELVAYFGVAEEGTYTVNCSSSGITAKPDSFIVYRARRVSITPDTTLLPPLFENINAYTYNEGWDTPSILFSLLGVDTPEGWDIALDYTYQIITITEDQYVPTNFGLWATSNWKPYSEGEDTPEEFLPAVEITYKDKIITLKAGQTARLHNADDSPFGFEEDLVIKANEVEAEAPKLQQKEIVIETNNVGTKVLPDAGYDALEAVLISVAIPETVITVATVDDLPTDSSDGTIAIVEG